MTAPRPTALVTDSNAQLPDALRERYDVRIVPLSVIVDGVDYAEGIDLDADGFYRRFVTGRSPQVQTAAPGPGRFLDAYRACAETGAESVLAVLLGSEYSGTVNAAQLAAGRSPIPVEVVDTHTASFGISFAVWAAGDCLAGGGTLTEAATTAATIGDRVDNVFVVRALDLARRGGRLVVELEHGGNDAIPVLRHRDGRTEVVAQVGNVEEAAVAMSAFILAGATERSLRVAIGVADAGAAPLWRALEAGLRGRAEVEELLRYRIGPSVGAHTGPGTAGAFFLRSGPR